MVGVLLAAVVAVLPLAAADTGLPYGLLPTRAQLNVMTHQMRAGLRVPGVTLVPQPLVISAVARAGYVQSDPQRECAVPECARAVAKNLRADYVVFGAVTREMAVVWSTDFTLMDVRTGRILREMNLGYKGDVQAMELGERYAGSCLGRILRGKPPCAQDRGW